MTLNETLEASRLAEEAWRSLGKRLRAALCGRATPLSAGLRKEYADVARTIQDGYAHSRVTSFTLATQMAKGKFRGEADIQKILPKLPECVREHVASGMTPPLNELSVRIMSLRFKAE